MKIRGPTLARIPPFDSRPHRTPLRLLCRRLVEQVILSVEKLLQFPRLGRVVREANDQNIRELVYQNYRVIYRIAGKRIEILTVVHGSRDLTRRPTPPWEIS